MNIIDVRNQVKRHATRKFSTRPISNITAIAVHHSASVSGDAFAFATYHVDNNGWAGCGYHYVIKLDGTIQWCGDWNTIRANVANNNSYIIGICMVGDFTKSAPTQSQLNSIKDLIEYLKEQIPTIKDVKGHGEFPGSSTTCPALDMNQFRKNLIEDVKEMPVLKFGSTGTAVKELQTLLNKFGYNLTVDGSFGNATRNAILNFQTKKGLSIDGMVGPQTWASLYQAVPKPQGTTPSTPTTSSSKSLITKIRRSNSDVWYAVVPKVSHIVDLNIGQVSVLEKLSTIVSATQKQGKKPVVAINGGFFGGVVENIGLFMDEGSYRQVPDEKFISLLLRNDGVLEVVKWTKDTPGIWAKRNDFQWGMGTSFSLIQNGELNYENSKYYSHFTTLQPRTAIGQRPNGDLVFVVVDGRRIDSVGMTGTYLAKLMLSLGCITAVNLDGGGSTEMVEVRNGVVYVINKPSDNGERKIGSSLIACLKQV